MTDYAISYKLSNETVYACYRGRFWRWDGSIWKESHLMTQKFERARAADKNLTPQAFLTNGAEFAPLDEYEIDCAMLDALENAKPCKNAPIEPVEEEPECAPAQNADAAVTTAENAVPTATAATPTISESGADASASTPATSLQNCGLAPAASAGGSSVPMPSAPGFDFGADDETNALLLQDAQTFITGNMARIMAAKHAHDLTANHYQGSWGKWCTAVGISRDTGDNMVRVAEQFGNIQLEGKSILDVQPMKLLYAAAKPSTPEVVKQAVFTGDITTYKEYQELVAQLKAEKERADAAEAHLEAANADINGLAERAQKAESERDKARADQLSTAKDCNRLGLKASQEKDRADKAEARAKDAENQLSGSRQVAEAAKLRADKLQAENAALKKQPIAAVVDEEEVERRANQRAHDIATDLAAEMTADLQARLEQASSGSEQDARDAYDSIILAGRSITSIVQSAKMQFRKLPDDQRETAINQFVHTLASAQGEVSACL